MDRTGLHRLLLLNFPINFRLRDIRLGSDSPGDYGAVRPAFRHCFRFRHEIGFMLPLLLHGLRNRFENGLAQFFFSLVGNQVCLLLLVAQKTQFNQHAGHCGAPQHQKWGLFHPPVVTLQILGEVFLHMVGKIGALGQEGILPQGKYNVGFRRIGIEPPVVVLIVAFLENHSILLLYQRHVGIGLVQPHHKSLRPVCGGRRS